MAKKNRNNWYRQIVKQNADHIAILNNEMAEVKNDVSSLLTKTENSWKTELNSFKEILDSIVNETTKTRDLAYETGREVEKYNTINMIARWLRGEEVRKDEALSTMHIISGTLI